ncbi:cysteine desulfurase [Candidatus Saccharibacteria bacterium]|nr:cysteine desulfurase [Candidatus Saccharibacteria bacterium]
MIYLDHAAATPMSERVVVAMTPFFAVDFYNPSAAYLPAVEVKRKYEEAKSELGRVIGAKGSEIVMTAGATESINLAFSAVAGKVLISEIEHAAVMGAAKRGGEFEVVKVGKDGVLDVEDLKGKMSPEVELVSVALANGEMGVIQPMTEISRVVKEERVRRLREGEKRSIWLHSDASQALGLVDVGVARLGVDMLTLNAAKAYGPKQMGLLYVGSEVRLTPVVVGGGQELGLRSGTENVAGTIGFAEAAKEAYAKMAGERKRLEGLRRILRGKMEEVEGARFLGNEKKQLVNFVSMVVSGVDAERVLFALDNKGVMVATGAACAANKGGKSLALGALGLTDEEIAGSLRLTLGRLNTEENVRRAGELIVEAIEAERRRNG